MGLFDLFGNSGKLTDEEKNRILDKAKDLANNDKYAAAWDTLTGKGKFAFAEVWHNFREDEVYFLLLQFDDFMPEKDYDKRCRPNGSNRALLDSIAAFERRYQQHAESEKRAKEFAQKNKNTNPAPKPQPKAEELPEFDDNAEKSRIDSMVRGGDYDRVFDMGCEYWQEQQYELGFYCYRKLALEKHLLSLQTCVDIMENGQMPLDKKEYGLWMELIAQHPELPDSERAKYQYACGEIYLRGRYAVKDVEKAIYWLTMVKQNSFATEQQINDAIFTLGTVYRDEGAVRDIEKCLYWMEQAAQGGNVEAMKICVDICGNGKDMPKNSEKYLYWLDKIAQTGDVDAMYQYANHCLTNENFLMENGEKAMEYLLKASNQGYPGADALLGMLTYTWERYEESLVYSKRAADKNNIDGIRVVIMLYEENKAELSFEDYAKYAEALVLHKEANKEEKTVAAGMLGKEYYIGEKVAMDIPKAVRMMTIAAENGDVWTMGMLGAIYKTADEVKDEDKAFSWLKKSAEGGVVPSMKLLANCYFDGKGVIQDYDKSFYWEKKAAEKGDADSMFKTGINYYYGMGTVKDTEKAKAWMVKAVQSGDELSAKNADKFIKEKNL